MAQKTCPTADQFQTMLLGKLPSAAAETLAEHVEHCPGCANTIANLEHDTLTDALRAGAQSTPDDPALKQLLERTKASIVPTSDATIDSAGSDGSLVANPNETFAMLKQAEAPNELGRLGGYRVLRQLGQGGMGMVFEAEDVKLERRVALKVMKPEIASNKQHRERFLREARTAAKVESDFICPIYQVGEENGMPFIAMPFLKGEPLDVRLKKGMRLPIEEIVRIGREVAEGLSAAHEAGLIHRDIKPGNIWLETQRTGPPRARILDFGLARVQGDDVHITASGAILGTPAFMAPEQARGDKNVDARADLFSLGCVLYVLCSGDIPFKAESTMGVLMALATIDPKPPHEISNAVPRSLSNLIMDLLAKDAAKRPATAKDVIERLSKIKISRGAESAKPQAARDAKARSTVLLPAEKPKSQTATVKRAAIGFGLAAFAAFALVGCVLTLLGGGIYYIVTDRGTIEIRTDDENVQVSVLKNGKEVEILDGTSKKAWVINTGEYTVRLKGDPEGLEIVMPEKFEMKRGGKHVVTVRRIPGPIVVGKKPEIKEVKHVPPGPGDYALSFDGETSHVEIDSLGFDGGPRTIEAYVTPARLAKPVETSGRPTICSHVGPGKSLALSQNEDVWRAQYGIDSTGQARISLADRAQVAKRTHLATVWDGKSVLLFVDGKRMADGLKVKTSGKPVTLHTRLGVGGLKDELRNYWPGIIDELRISKTARYDKDFTPAQRHETDKDTLALYHFDEGAGDKLTDSSGNNHHGKIVGAKWVNADRTPPVVIDHALHFNGKTAHVRLPFGHKDASPITIEATVIPDEALPGMDGQAIVANNQSNGLSLEIGKQPRFGFLVMGTRYQRATSKDPVRFGAGARLAAVFNGKEVRLFVNGKLADVRLLEGTYKASPYDLLIGASAETATTIDFPFLGTIDEVRISKTARYDKDYLPAAQLEPDADTLALYHFDEGQGDVLKDSSGNNHHGKIVGAKWVKVNVAESANSADPKLTEILTSPRWEWQKPETLSATLNSSFAGIAPTRSADGNSLVFFSDRDGKGQLWETRRGALNQPYEKPTPLKAPGIDGLETFWDPCLAADGLTLYFLGKGTLTNDRIELLAVQRKAVDQPWGIATKAAESLGLRELPWALRFGADGRVLVFASSGPGGQGKSDLWMCRRSSADTPFGDPVNLGPSVNTADAEFIFALAADGCTLLFLRDENERQLWLVTRPNTSAAFGPAVQIRLAEENLLLSPADLSADGRTLIFASRGKNAPLMMMRRMPAATK